MVTLEVCVDSLEGAQAAVRGGADRIELCSSLAEGGLTPSYGLMQAAAALPIPCMAMIRPRSGNFQFQPSDVDVMLADIDAARAAGLTGVVLGAQAENGGLDLEILSRLCSHAQGLSCTLHRVIDVVSDPLKAIDDAVALGFERVLTSGGQLTAIGGLHTIAVMHKHANGRLSIMPGSGLHGGNVVNVLATGVSEVHASCSIAVSQQNCLPESIEGGTHIQCRRAETSGKKVSDLRAAIAKYSVIA